MGILDCLTINVEEELQARMKSFLFVGRAKAWEARVVKARPGFGP